jgi:hypothetical protein
MPHAQFKIVASFACSRSRLRRGSPRRITFLLLILLILSIRSPIGNLAHASRAVEDCCQLIRVFAFKIERATNGGE